MQKDNGDIICDACGMPITDEEALYQCPFHICHYFGYGSENDLNKVETHFCMACADLFLQLLISFCKHSGKSILKEYEVGKPLSREEQEEFYKQLVGEIESVYGQKLGNCGQ